MNKTKLTKSLMAIVMGSALLSGTAFSEDTFTGQAKAALSDAGTKIDSSMKKVDGYMSDSSITAKVKAALLNDSTIKSSDISVNTHQGVVTLEGIVPSQDLAGKTVMVAKGVTGVRSVSDKLRVQDSAQQTFKDYVGDAATTSEIKAKLIADDIVPSRKIKVSTTNGVVQLSGTVDSQAQLQRAEGIAKAIEGVKSVKNDLTVKQ
ncbi:hyperosmotically inducible protein [Izhakiella capsodis]|uniref:Osmotically-inducible protein Y n=1 Tax=Izhakiella capsodis TaxID=1367852 RepID=A0A1I4WZI7_9GAMM|nr:molecular chaperone OsmY [Izhakiella capsodis]SFN19141.1 hyperosmotically inducible protein [Izhakiella capsodis]